MLFNILFIVISITIIGNTGTNNSGIIIAKKIIRVPRKIYIILDKSKCFPLLSTTFIYSYKAIALTIKPKAIKALFPIIIAIISNNINAAELIILLSIYFTNPPNLLSLCWKE